MESIKPSSPPFLLFFLLLLSTSSSSSISPPSPSHKPVCIIGSGIGGSSLAHFLKTYSISHPNSTLFNHITIFEKNSIVGGRTATVSLAGDTFEAGASIIHPKNLHALKFASSLNLSIRTQKDDDDDDDSFAIWDGTHFVFKTLPSQNSKIPLYPKIVNFLNSLLLFRRYGFSLIRMQRFVKKLVDNFLRFYMSHESRPVFTTVEEMLKWADLYGLTQRTLQDELAAAGLSQRLISELITVITRINYGQNVTISGLGGAVSLAGSDPGLWSVEGGNWQIAAGLIRRTNVSLHLHEEIISISYVGGSYELNSTKGNSYSCDVTIVATPLDELNIRFSPPISIPKRKLQHTHATFVRGLWNPAYFGLNSVSEIPELVGTIEAPDIPFSSISILKKYSEEDMAYKVFSRAPMPEELLDLIFSVRKETVRINWAAYPHYEAPEVFAPFVLDGLHLYYINSFENAASSIECSAVAAENVARLILSRLSSGSPSDLPNLRKSATDEGAHFDL
ncbi:farnesylcysteine lyase-like [Tasmannia lanceolata]|uniref:farnesylcysteine lyase-like n=1 Tax=Tasmannia lanceolata TaxID=3420 RepID=UPI004062A1F2